MVRGATIGQVPKWSSPHARGDGPDDWDLIRRRMLFSPRAWGWSGTDLSADGAERVLPTRVGMVRRLAPLGEHSKRSPHARGDGPLLRLQHLSQPLFSPRAWGWSRLSRIVRPLVNVLPTRVGMVRSMMISSA